MATTYHTTYADWQADPEAFWLKAARQMDWTDAPKTAFDPSADVYGRWFPDATCNTCYNAVDRHVAAGRGDQAAIIYDSPITNSQKTLTYRELQQEVAALGAVLQGLGVEKGDRVIIYMPMIAEAGVAMLACARIGAVHSVVFGGFAARELATRINDCAAKVVIAASCGIEPGRVVAYKPLLDEAIEISDAKPEACVILQRPECTAELQEGRDIDYAASVAAAKAAGQAAECVSLAATDPLYVLYTSGTTGAPKGVVRDNGGHMTALHWSMSAMYDIQPGEVFWAASDVGWVVGHSYIVYAPLFAGATTVLFEGKPIGTPDAGTFWRVIEEHKVVTLFTAPTAIRAIRKEDPEGDFIGKYDLGHFRALFLAGERADPETIRWAQDQLQVPVIDHWWQTETGWTIAGNPKGLGLLPVKLGSPAVPMPGYDIQILDDEGVEVPRGDMGNVTVKLPLPPSCLPTLWNAEDRFRSSYLATFPGYYETGDAGYMDEDGYLFIMARTDDIINVAGHRLSTGAMEEIVAEHPDIAECAVVGVKDDMKGQIPAGFVVLTNACERSMAEIEKELITMVRQRIGPVAAFKTVVPILRLPKTRSGKVLRGIIQRIADGQSYKMPATIDDPAILDEITASLKDHGWL